MNIKISILALCVFTCTINVSFSITLREAWQALKEEAKQIGEELKEELLNIDLEDLFEEEKKPKKTIRYARNREEALRSYRKLQRKYTAEFECIHSARNQKKCLKKNIKEKFADRSNNPYVDYFEELKIHNHKAQHDYKFLGFFNSVDAEETKDNLQRLQTICKESFKKKLRSRRNCQH